MNFYTDKVGTKENLTADYGDPYDSSTLFDAVVESSDEADSNTELPLTLPIIENEGNDVKISSDDIIEEEVIDEGTALYDLSMSNVIDGCDTSEMEISSSESEEENQSQNLKIKIMPDDVDEDIFDGPLITKNEIIFPKIEPYIGPVPEGPLIHVGTITSIVGATIVIECPGTAEYEVIDVDTVILTSERIVVGRVFDTFGPVLKPFYTVLFNSRGEISNLGLEVGLSVMTVRPLLKTCLTKNLDKKGTDASNVYDEEVDEHEMEFSDDEKEQEFKLKKKIKKSMALAEDGEIFEDERIIMNTERSGQNIRTKRGGKTGYNNPRNPHPVHSNAALTRNANAGHMFSQQSFSHPNVNTNFGGIRPSNTMQPNLNPHQLGHFITIIQHQQLQQQNQLYQSQTKPLKRAFKFPDSWKTVVHTSVEPPKDPRFETGAVSENIGETSRYGYSSRSRSTNYDNNF